jgi:hypothetical protein
MLKAPGFREFVQSPRVVIEDLEMLKNHVFDVGGTPESNVDPLPDSAIVMELLGP